MLVGVFPNHEYGRCKDEVKWKIKPSCNVWNLLRHADCTTCSPSDDVLFNRAIISLNDKSVDR